MDPNFYPFRVATLECLCSTLVGKNELKCTKNFKALYPSLTKNNGTVFRCFGTEVLELNNVMMFCANK